MKKLFVATILALVLASCHAQLVYPDEFESMKAEEEKRRTTISNHLKLPSFQPTVQSVNDVESPPYISNGGFQQGPPPPSGISTTVNDQPKLHLPTSALPASKKPSLTPLDTFLPPKWRDHVLRIISQGTTKFTLDMDRAIENSSPHKRDNLIFSPVSLTITLAMVLLASGGKTFDEVAKILGLESGVDISHHSEIVHQIIGLLVLEGEKRQILDPNLPQTRFAFGIFVEDGFPVREQFRAISEKVYKSEVISVDFSNHSREAQATINQWVSDKTMGKIQNMLNEAPSPLTDVIITSAMYFSGEWDQHFSEENTKRKPFKVDEDETIYVDMMVNGADFPFYEDKELGAKIVAFPYKGFEVSMYAVLPTKPGTAALQELKRKLTPDNVDSLIDKMVNSSCIIAYPKMKLSSTLKLQSALEALGLKSLFDPREADLSVLSPGRGANETLTSHGPQQQKSAATPQSTFPGGFRQPTKSLHTDFTYPASRFGQGARNDYYRYEDRDNGYMVEQWDTGYNIQKLWPYRRAKRQSRPIQQEFVDFLNAQKLPNFGVDELRNSAGISNPGLYADDVIHKVEMTVNEKGTEAAAATSIILDRTGDFKRFIANRPFLFFIRHEPAKVIWFWGTINRPSPHYDSL